MSILVVLDPCDGYHTKRFLEDAKSFPEIKIMKASQLIYPKVRNLLKYKVFYFYSSLLVGENNYLFARKLAMHRRKVINETHYKIGYVSKILLYTLLSENKIPTPKFFRIFSPKMIKKMKNMKFPIVVKHAYRHRGSEVKLIKDFSSLKEFVKNNKNKLKYYVFQQYIPYKRDIRVIYVGDKVLGAIQRIGRDFRANISLGGYAKKYKINEKLESIAKKVSDVLYAKVFSIDILEDIDGKYYVIDFHNVFQFKGFESATKKKVPYSIYEFLVKLKENLNKT